MANVDNNNDNENKLTEEVNLDKSISTDKNKNKKKKSNWFKKLMLGLILFLVGVVVLFFVVINLPSTHNWIAKKAVETLNTEFNTEMEIDQVSVDFFGDVSLAGFKVTDKRGLDFIQAEKLTVSSDWYQLVKELVVDKSNSIHFDEMKLTNADVKIITYKGDSISNFINYVNSFNAKKKDPNKEPFHLDAQIEVINSKVLIINQNSEGDKGKWLDATNFNLNASQVTIDGADVYADVEKFNFVTERWDKKHSVKDFSGEVTLNKEFLNLKGINLLTDHTSLQGDIQFNLNDGSWKDFNNAVRWDMNIMEGSYFSGYDISYFVTNWDNYKKIYFHGEMEGPINDFVLKNVEIKRDQLFLAANTLTLKNVLKKNFTIKTPELITDFTYQELKASLPTFISSKLKNFADDFGRLRYRGMARVTPKEVYIANGQLVSGIGNAKINQLYLWEYTTRMPRYKGRVQLDRLDASVITKSNQVKEISGLFNIEGKSFDVNTMVITTTSSISRIEIADKVINNLHLDGNLNHKIYTGLIQVNDPKVRGKVNGQIDFKTSTIKADVDAKIDQLQLNHFTNSSTSQIIKGEFHGQIAMSTLDDLQLDANLSNVAYSTNSESYFIPEAKVNAFIENGRRIVDVDAPEMVNGRIEGTFNLADLPKMIENGLSKILVTKRPYQLFNGQDFTMDFYVEQDLVKIFSPQLSLPDGATIKGEYYGNTNDLIVDINANHLTYLLTNNKELEQVEEIVSQVNSTASDNEEDKTEELKYLLVDFISVKVNTTKQENQIDALIDRVEFKENVFRNIKLVAENRNDEYLDISARFDYGSPENELDGTLQSFAINLQQYSNEAGDYVFDLSPTEIEINDAKWSIHSSESTEHSIIYDKATGYFNLNNLNLTSEDSQLVINNARFKNAKDFEANISVINFQLAKIFDMLEAGNTMDIQGIANGTANISRTKEELRPLIDIQVEDIRMEDRQIGTMFVKAKGSDLANIYDINAYIESSDNFDNNHLDISGTIDNNPKSPLLDIQVNLNDFDIAFTNQFVKGVFSNLRGKSNGTLLIKGPINDIDYSGDIALEDAGLKLDFIGVDYQFEDTVLNISKGLAQLNNIEISDNRSNSSGTISGVVQFETISSMSVALFVRTDNLLLLNTTQKDFDVFWGKVYATGTLFVDGPVTALNLSTPEEDGMTILDNSVFTFNSDSSSNVDEFKMLRFLHENNEGEKVVQEMDPRSGANISVDFTANIGKGTTVNVLVGEDIGDIMVRGTSDRFNFKMSREGNLSMNGRYDVDNGMFDYKMQYKDLMIGEKKFRIERGSSINWDGDVMAPELNIAANYITSVSNVGEYLNMGTFPSVDIKVNAYITQTLKNPSVAFDMQAIDVSSQVKEALASKLNVGENKFSQIVPVLLFNTFNVDESGGIGLDLASSVEGSFYNLLLKGASSSLNTLDNKLNWDFNYIQGSESSRIGDRINAGLAYSLSPRLLIKGALGIPVSTNEVSTEASNNFYSKEFTAEYDISKKNDRSLLLRGYTKPTDIGMLNTFNNQTYGVGIAWRKNFQTIFRNNKKQKQNSKTKRDSVKIDSISTYDNKKHSVLNYKE